MDKDKIYGKFLKGLLTGGIASVGTFLTAQGCQFNNLQEFAILGLFATLTGSIHAAVNVWEQKTAPSK